MLRYRIFYILTLTATVLFYLFFTGYLSFFMMAAAILLPFVSWALTFFGVRKTSIRIEPESPYANKDEEFLLYIVLKNASIVPIAQAGLKFCCENSLCGEKRNEALFLSVGSGPEQAAEYRMKSQYCGKITVELTRVKYYDYLGIFTIVQKPKLYTEIFVAPKPCFLDAQIDTAANPDMESNTYSKEKPGSDPSEIFDIRPFRSGDRLRSIHWKLSSKLDELMVKEFSLPTDSSVLLLVELMAADMAALDTVVEALASLSRFLTENQIHHCVEWYDKEHDRFEQNLIENDEDLAVLLNAVLSARQYRDEPCALACRSRLDGIVKKYPHVIYVTGRLTDTLTAFCDGRTDGEKTTVLYCGKMDSGQQKQADTLNTLKIDVIEIPSGKIQESLSGLMI